MRILILISLLMLGCGVDIGNSSKSDSDNDNSTNIINNPNRPGNGATNAKCEGVQSVDGAGGFLWKPESEKDGKPVVLFPESYAVKFNRVVSLGLNGDVYEGSFDGFHNGNRQHWRFKESANLHAGELYADDCQWQIPNPKERQD